MICRDHSVSTSRRGRARRRNMKSIAAGAEAEARRNDPEDAIELTREPRSPHLGVIVVGGGNAGWSRRYRRSRRRGCPWLEVPSEERGLQSASRPRVSGRI